ncbi:MAG: hypothetical protein CVV31_07175 [Methanomicrobiales archaeon HGW-Methanomicrobiales-2]|nr:MAG: hypothetical protein CVV31_07175 [Methanomicrobiales archaeon HGW-Methanomicrobiales-2]
MRGVRKPGIKMGLFWKKSDTGEAKRLIEEGKRALDPRQKLACFDKAIHADPNYAPGWNNKGNVLLSLGSYDEALECCSKAVELSPGYSYAWNARGNALKNLGRHAEAVKSYEKAISLKRDYAYPWNGKGDALRELGQYSQAIACYDRALKIKSFSWPWNGKGMALIEMGRFEDALSCFDRVISISPTFVWPWYGKGRALEELGRLQEAARCYGTALKIDPELRVAETRLNRISANLKPGGSQCGWKSEPDAQSIPLTANNFRQELADLFSNAQGAGRTSIEVNSGELHRSLGGYPGPNHRMPVCCDVMYQEMRDGDRILNAPEKGKGASLTIRYKLPRTGGDALPHREVLPDRQAIPASLASRYTKSMLIGQGGFARVFMATKSDGSVVAVKVPIALDPSTGRSFIAEILNWVHLDHRNIVRVVDYNILPVPFIEMEYCSRSLSTIDKPVPSPEAAMLMLNICEGLKYAHARSIVHRDLKPQNIMLSEGVPKITDWGLSKVVSSASLSASPSFTAHFAAPEQIRGDRKDERTDIWQLGVILYELVTGRLPFTGESMVEIGMAIVTKVPERPGAVHPDAQPLDAIILKCLEKNPKQRYQSVVELQKDLATYLKANYSDSLKESIRINDLHRSAYYCGDLVLICMKAGDLTAAYKYAVDLARYPAGDVRAQATELAEQIKLRIEMGAHELPDELVQKAEVVVHQVRVR